MAVARELRHVLSRAPALSFMVPMVNVCEISLVTMNNRKKIPEIKKTYYYQLLETSRVSSLSCRSCHHHFNAMEAWSLVEGWWCWRNDCVLSLWPLSRLLRWSR